MATYEEIYGKRVKDLSADPTLDSSYEGQVWYNSTTGTLKSLVQIKAFSSAATYPLPTGAYGQLGGAGTQTAGLAFGGRRDGVPTDDFDKTNEYSGFSWTAAPDLGTGRYGVNGCGTQTAALGAGGYRFPTPPTGNQTTVEEYDGSSWTAGGALPTGISSAAMNGAQTAALLSGGNATRAETLSYDGSSWTAQPSLSAGRRSLRGSGTSTDALVFGGLNPSTPLVYATTSRFDGSSWTDVNSMNTAIYDMCAMGNSSSHVASNSGHNGTANTNTTEEWDGTNWTTAPTSTVTHRGGTGFGTATAGVSAVGGSPPYQACEEYNSNINAFTAAAFASGGALSTSRAQFGSAKHGTQNAGLAFGGFNWPNSNRSETEEYGGSSWTSGGALPGAQRQMGGTGTQTAALGYGGQPGFPNTTTLEYNGSSWTSGGALNSGGNFMYGSASGTQTAGLRSGSGTAASTTVEEYDGSSWTSANAMSVARVNSFVDGAQTATIITAGEAPAAPDAVSSVTRLTEEYDGTNWSSGTSSLFFLASGGVSGGAAAPTAFMITGGDGPEVTNNTGATQEYDGTAFTNTANLGTPRRQLNGGGTQAAGLVFGGTEASTTALTATEEYTGSTSTVTASTLTSS